MHLEVLRNDLKTIKLLIAKHPDLNITNNDGETAIDLAKKHKFEEALKLLVPPKLFDKINHEFCYELNCENFAQDSLEPSTKTQLKVLEIINCGTFCDAIEKLELFKASSHLFVVIIHILEHFTTINQRPQALVYFTKREVRQNTSRCKKKMISQNMI